MCQLGDVRIIRKGEKLPEGSAALNGFLYFSVLYFVPVPVAVRDGDSGAAPSQQSASLMEGRVKD